MSYLCEWIFVITVLQLIVISSSQGLGTVHIGVKGGPSTTVFSHNKNTPQQQLKIYLEITNPANPTQNVALKDTVDISCEVSDSRPGYSKVTFHGKVINGNIPNIPLNHTIRYNMTSSGRPVDIRCYGQSQGMTCPVNSSAASPQPQFCRATSISAPVSMTIHPAPVVSFCSPNVIVPNNKLTTSSFTLRLSEMVKDNDVDISCRMVTPSSSINVSIKKLLVPINASTPITVDYTINRRGDPVDVQCSAQSRGGGTQYLSGTSIGTGTGANSKAQFILSAGSVTLLPAVTSANSMTLKGILTLDAPDPGISFTCRAVVIDNLTVALQLVDTPSCDFSLTPNTTITTTTPPPTTTAIASNASSPTSPTSPPDLTSTWIMDESSFPLLTKDDTYKLVIARRQLDVVAAVRELVVITCCVRSGTVKYLNMSAAMLSAVDLTPAFCTNCTGGPTSSTLASERVIQNVAFREVAPCPCDLTYSVCDTNCCCDTECSADTKKTFTYCIPGPFGGQRDLVHPHMCGSNHTFKVDWFPFTCVQFETNAFLGLFYGNTPALKIAHEYSSLLTKQKPFFSYRESERRYMDANSELEGYKGGASVRTGKADKSIPTEKRGILTLPGRSVGGACLTTLPVRYQRERTSNCVVAVTDATCRFDSVLSATMYAESTAKSNPPCPHAYSVLQKYGGNDIVIADTFVSYYCANDDASYVKSSTKYATSPTELVTFSTELLTENCSYPCEDPVCIQYNENLYSTPSLPNRCSWDDGFTQPPIPSRDSNLCRNSVVSVTYSFTWTADTIVKLNATVILAPVTFNPAQSLTQTFDVKFEHETTTSSNDTDNYDNVKGAYDRSGKPGYDFGKPLISGCPVYDSATSEFQSVDRTPSRQMAVFEPSQDGLCNTATRRPLKFGEDIVSSCKLRLNINELNNCTDLRQLLLNHLSVLMPADMIGRQGSNDPKNSTMWVTVLRDIPSLNETTGVENATVNNSTGNFTDVYMPVDNIRGTCFNVTNQINLVVLYGDAGLTNSYPIREVVGARVSYTRTNWSMSCSGADALRCRNNSQYVETFMLTSTVTFIKIPALQPQPIIKFYSSKDVSCTTDTCARFYLDFDQSICHFDTCWSELLYPLTASYDSDPPIYTLGFSLIIVFFIVGYFMVTRPWF